MSVDQGHQRVDQVSGASGAIAEGAAEVRALIDQVSTASAEQARGVDQVAQAVATMERVTQSAAATAEESAAASEELSVQAETARGVVRMLSGLVGGSTAAGRAGPTVRADSRAPRPDPRRASA